MKIRFPGCIALACALVIGTSGCLIEHETPIEPDSKVDPKLEGVWELTQKASDEIRSDRDEDDIGAKYIIFSKVDERTYKGIFFDRIEKDRDGKFSDVLVSTKAQSGHRFLLVRLADYEKAKAGEDQIVFKNWIVDYEFNKSGDLFLRFLYADEVQEALAAHPMKHDQSKQAFSPLTLKGTGEEILGFYTDSKVRALFTSCGKYKKLQPMSEP